jgi:hypothetical protein
MSGISDLPPAYRLAHLYMNKHEHTRLAITLVESDTELFSILERLLQARQSISPRMRLNSLFAQSLTGNKLVFLKNHRFNFIKKIPWEGLDKLRFIQHHQQVFIMRQRLSRSYILERNSVCRLRLVRVHVESVFIPHHPTHQLDASGRGRATIECVSARTDFSADKFLIY